MAYNWKEYCNNYIIVIDYIETTSFYVLICLNTYELGKMATYGVITIGYYIRAVFLFSDKQRDKKLPK